MGINMVLVMWQQAFGPYPFILLTLLLSCTAAIQAPIIMMSKNRKELRDRHRAEDDYLINLKAEIEIQILCQQLARLEEGQKRTEALLKKPKTGSGPW